MKPGTYVRMSAELKRILNNNGSHEHVEEFGDCIGFVEGFVNYSDGYVGPEVNVRWLPSKLRYGYDPKYLEEVQRDVENE